MFRNNDHDGNGYLDSTEFAEMLWDLLKVTQLNDVVDDLKSRDNSRNNSISIKKKDGMLEG